MYKKDNKTIKYSKKEIGKNETAESPEVKLFIKNWIIAIKIIVKNPKKIPGIPYNENLFSCNFKLTVLI